MIRYIAKRVLMMIPVLLAVSFVVFFLMDLAPGDLVDSMNTMDMSLEEQEALRKAKEDHEAAVERAKNRIEYRQKIYSRLEQRLSEAAIRIAEAKREALMRI